MAAINFLLTPTGSLVQVVVASLPLLALLAYFVFLAHVRPTTPCYTDTLSEEQMASECHLIPISDMIFVFLCCGLLWTVIAAFMTVYVPKRRALIDQYLTNGKTIIGDVHYHPDQQQGCCRLGKYGNAVYPHPNYKKLPVFIRRQVQVFELYTRERITLLFLPGKSFSAQPKEELEANRGIISRNQGNMRAIALFSWACVSFCFVSVLYALKVMYQLDKNGLYDYQPDFEEKATSFILASVGIVTIPIIAFGSSWIAWTRHEKWMTIDHKILEEDDQSWYEGNGEEMTRYQPPVPQV